VNDDRRHSAMPKLYGAPAYARPPIVPVSPVERPFDPDDLPLEAERSDDDPGLADQAQAQAGGPVASASSPSKREAKPRVRSRALRIRLPGRDEAGR